MSLIIPCTLYMNDNNVLNTQFVVEPNVEASYFISVPKGTSGNIVRIELGPTDFLFHRFYMRLRCFRTGKDTDKEWITLPPPQIPGEQS